MSLWTIAPGAGAAPSTAVACDRTTLGGLEQRAPSGSNYLARTHIGCTSSGMWILYDRLCHQGGLDGTVTTAQTTNLPTAALTRYTDGVGVMAMVENYSTGGATPTTFTLSYTNQAGTSGQTSQPVAFGGTGNRENVRAFLVPLQSGDYGVRSVESLTLASTTSGIGNFGITLIRPLLFLPVNMTSSAAVTIDSLFHLGMLPEEDEACLAWLMVPGNSSTATGTMVASLKIAEAL